MKYTFPQVRKAAASFLVGLAGFLLVVLPLVTDGDISNADIVAMIAALASWLGGTAAVYTVPNATIKEK